MWSGHLGQWQLQEKHNVGSACVHSCAHKETTGTAHCWSGATRDVWSFPCVVLSFVLRVQIIASVCKPARWMCLKGNFYNSTSEIEQNPADFCLLWFSFYTPGRTTRNFPRSSKPDCKVFAKNPRQRDIREGSTGSPGRLAAHTPAWAPALLFTRESASHPSWSVLSSALC